MCWLPSTPVATTPLSRRVPRTSTASGPLVKAETSGTYILPAHTAFFNGNLPRPLGHRFQLDDTQVACIWRSTAARPGGNGVAVPFDRPTLMAHYRRRGFRVIGAGGVTFFDPDEPNNTLPRLFDEFHY